jgi:hypothetical protein
MASPGTPLQYADSMPHALLLVLGSAVQTVTILAGLASTLRGQRFWVEAERIATLHQFVSLVVDGELEVELTHILAMWYLTTNCRSESINHFETPICHAIPRPLVLETPMLI